MKRKLVATSHAGAYSYHVDEDRYIYQRREADGVWIGWLCSLPAWEFTFSKVSWMSLIPQEAN